MASRAQVRASRALTWMGVLVGTALGGVVPLSFPLLDLVYYQPTDPPVFVPVMIWPLAPVKLAIGLLFGPVAGLITGVASQIMTLVLAGYDLAETWNWVVAGALGGFFAGWLPGHLPGSWRPSGDHRLAGAAITGVFVTTIAYLPVVFDPLLRAGATWPFALGEYATIVIPTSILAALTLPLVLAAGLRWRLHPAIQLSQPTSAARPGWRPFAIAFAVAVAAPLAPLYVPSNVRVIGQVSAAAGPAAAPAPGATGSSDREVSVSLGDPPGIDPSCAAEGAAHSPPVWAAVHVTLYNETGAPIGVSWLDYDGHRDEEHAIDAGGPLFGEWGAGHLFVLTGPGSSCLMVFKVLGTSPISIHLRS
jgi:hypothetical protein